ncbi:hypothetical protein NQU36_27910, partial [Escherichia coli]|uniref:hypothetical protein n=1 Tax=Escherichia coli TaxID=562 RepID=UPI00211867F6
CSVQASGCGDEGGVIDLKLIGCFVGFDLQLCFGGLCACLGNYVCFFFFAGASGFWIVHLYGIGVEGSGSCVLLGG